MKQTMILFWVESELLKILQVDKNLTIGSLNWTSLNGAHNVKSLFKRTIISQYIIYNFWQTTDYASLKSLVMIKDHKKWNLWNWYHKHRFLLKDSSKNRTHHLDWIIWQGTFDVLGAPIVETFVTSLVTWEFDRMVLHFCIRFCIRH